MTFKFDRIEWIQNAPQSAFKMVRCLHRLLNESNEDIARKTGGRAFQMDEPW